MARVNKLNFGTVKVNETSCNNVIMLRECKQNLFDERSEYNSIRNTLKKERAEIISRLADKAQSELTDNDLTEIASINARIEAAKNKHNNKSNTLKERYTEICATFGINESLFASYLANDKASFSTIIKEKMLEGALQLDTKDCATREFSDNIFASIGKRVSGGTKAYTTHIKFYPFMDSVASELLQVLTDKGVCAYLDKRERTKKGTKLERLQAERDNLQAERDNLQAERNNLLKEIELLKKASNN